MKFSYSGLCLLSTFLLSSVPSTCAAPSPAQALTVRDSSTCPTCNPQSGLNQCDTTTSCIYIWGHPGPNLGPNYCACRAGYRGDGIAPGDTTAQFLLPWPSQQGRVFVKPGVVCNTLCDHWELGPAGCAEVTVQSSCF